LASIRSIPSQQRQEEINLRLKDVSGEILKLGCELVLSCVTPTSPLIDLTGKGLQLVVGLGNIVLELLDYVLVGAAVVAGQGSVAAVLLFFLGR